MKVVSYFNVVPSKNKSQEKHDILTKFIEGVNAAGDTGILHQGDNLIKADVGFIQGWQHETGKNASHLRLRQSVIDRTANTHVCTADANISSLSGVCRTECIFLYVRSVIKVGLWVLSISIVGYLQHVKKFVSIQIGQLLLDCTLEIDKHKASRHK